MPRPRKPGAPEPKRRSRKGCWPCKARKVKCGEEKPSCLNCERQRESCDYSIRLNWDGRTKRNPSVGSPGSLAGGHAGGMFVSLPLSPPDPVQQPSSSNAPQESPVPDLAPENPFWGSRMPETLTPETPYTGNIHNIHDSPSASDQPLDHFSNPHSRALEAARSPPQMQDILISWPEHSPQSVTSPQDGVHYGSALDRSSGIGPFSTFAFTPTSVSAPVSYLRHSMEAPKRSTDHSVSDYHTISDHQPKRIKLPHYPLPDDTSHTFAHDSPTTQASVDFEGDVSAHARKFSMSSSFSPQEHSSISPTDTSAAAQDSYSKVTSGPLVLDNYLYHPRVSLPDSPFAQARALDGETDQIVDVSNAERKWRSYLNNVTDNYGLDHGRPDSDLNKNDDHAAIDVNYALDLISPQWKTTRHDSNHRGSQTEAGAQNSGSSRYTYYESSVPINIPRYLSPLPSSLLENPINLMYFHHFINHTARMLVPHDCEDNPFVSVLPSMAIVDSNLLNLMLAYSASHRARYLEHPEPANRIAHWVSNVFPTLRVALEDPHENVTDSHLATAIMLLSLKIISPSTFEVPIPWQSHLKLARDLFLARGEQMAYSGNRIGIFIARWLGYLDVLGALSCRRNDPPLLTYQSLLAACSNGGEHDDFCVDCFTGFTPRTGLFLARLGGLVNRCDHERFDEMGNFLSDWSPSHGTILEAEALASDLKGIQARAHASGKHYHYSGPTDIVAVDKAFRYAGLLHLHRRVLGASPYASSVKDALDELTQAISNIGPGTPAEIGILFPLFTAGCETRDPQQRLEVMERIKNLEKTGMKQIQNARTLMQRCWDEDVPWIALAQGEFLG